VKLRKNRPKIAGSGASQFFFDRDAPSPVAIVSVCSKATSIEIEQLNARVVEAETRLKTEVTRIKKKLQIQITELEMSLDSANKTNIDLQKTIKKQSLQLTELTAHYDEVQRQLQVTLDQLSISQRKIQAFTAEIEEIRATTNLYVQIPPKACVTLSLQALRGKRSAEQMVEEAGTRINELTTINVNLASAKSKIEQELSTIVADYDEVTKELRISDERYQRIQVSRARETICFLTRGLQTELKHTVEILHEEQERVVKIEAIKKSLEIEVKNLSVRLEEVEANAIVGGKRIISKLEARMRDMEVELDEEKRRHARDHQDPAQEGAHRQGGHDPVRGGPEEHRPVERIAREGQLQGVHVQETAAGTGRMRRGDGDGLLTSACRRASPTRA
jgi:DNA repair exonuclease SbcCD ATPase subunit